MRTLDLEMIKDVCLHQARETGEQHNLVIMNPVDGKYKPEKGSRYEVKKASDDPEDSVILYTSDQLFEEERLRDENNEEEELII